MQRPKLVPRREQRARAQEQARSGEHTLLAMEDRTLRLAEKASSCGQEMGHRG